MNCSVTGHSYCSVTGNRDNHQLSRSRDACWSPLTQWPEVTGGGDFQARDVSNNQSWARAVLAGRAHATGAVLCLRGCYPPRYKAMESDSGGMALASCSRYVCCSLHWKTFSPNETIRCVCSPRTLVTSERKTRSEFLLIQGKKLGWGMRCIRSCTEICCIVRCIAFYGWDPLRYGHKSWVGTPARAHVQIHLYLRNSLTYINIS